MTAMTTIDYIGWIRDGLKKARRRQADLARHLGIDPAQMSRAMQGKRALRTDEIESIAAFLGLTIPAPPPSIQKAAGSIQGVKVVGLIDYGGWVDQRIAARKRPEVVGAVIDVRWPIAEQAAYQIASAPAVPSRLREGDYILTVPYPKYRVRPLPGDVIVRELVRDELRSYRLIECIEQGLVDMMTGEPMQGDGEFIALMIGFQVKTQ